LDKIFLCTIGIIITLFTIGFFLDQKALAVPVQTDGTWYVFFHNGLDSFATECLPDVPRPVFSCRLGNTGQADEPYLPGVGNPPWTFTCVDNCILRVIDAWASWEVYEVFDNGVSLGRTDTPSNPGGFANTCRDPVTELDCLFFPNSRGDFILGTGSHSITIKVVGTNVGFETSSGTGFFSTTVATGTVMSVPIIIEATDPEGKELTFSIGTEPSSGFLNPIIQINPTTVEIVYTPELRMGEQFVGNDFFTVKVSDGTDESIAAMTILVGELQVINSDGSVILSHEDRGGEVFTNLDNDDNDLFFDVDDNDGVSGEDDLLSVRVNFPGADHGITTLDWIGGFNKVRIWEEQTKQTQIFLNEFPIEVFHGKEIWVEGRETSDFERDVVFILNFQSDPDIVTEGSSGFPMKPVPAIYYPRNSVITNAFSSSIPQIVFVGGLGGGGGGGDEVEIAEASATVSPGLKLIFYVEDRDLPSRTGHGFIQFRANVGPVAGNPNLVYGFTVPGSIPKFLLFGPGLVSGPHPVTLQPIADSDFDEPLHGWTWRLIYEVDTATWNRVGAFVDERSANPPFYNLFTNNCVDFIQDVANSAGVTLPDSSGLFGISDPQKIVDHLQGIGDGGTFRVGDREAMIDFNTDNVAANETPDPPSVDHCSFSNIVEAAQQGQATLAAALGFDFHQETLSSLNVNVGSQCKVIINNVDLNSAITIIDFGEGPAVLQILEAFHTYESLGLREARVIEVHNGVVNEYLFNINVGAGNDICEVSINVPDPPEIPTIILPDPPASVPRITGPDTTQPIPGAIDHYLGYKVKESKHTEKFQKFTVTLSDQFEPDAIYTVKKPVRLYNPVDKNGEGISDEITHLLGYKIKAPEGEKFEKVTNVLVTNQFGNLILDVKKPKLLLVPSSKDLTGTPDELDSITVNHYKCYDAKETKGTPKFEKRLVTLSDPNFGESKVFEVKKPKHLCTPVDKNNEGIIDKENHLMCYDLKKIKDEPKFEKRNVFTNNQFEPEDLEVKKEHQLCVPSTKEIL